MTQYTCMAQNFVRNEFKALWWGFLMGLCITGLLLFSNEVFAVETIEDFDLYPVNTYLDVGTGNWFDPAYPMIVKDDKLYSAPNSAYFNWNEGYRNGMLDLRGNNTKNLAFKVYLKECWIGQPFNFVFRDWDLNIFAKFYSFEPVDDECQIKGLQSGSDEIIGSVPLNVWTTWVFQQSIINDLSYVRYSVNGGFDFTDWLPIYDGVFRDIDVFWIDGVADNVFYVDDITDGLPVCELGSCNLCEVQSTCIEASCEWFYSIFLQDYFCVEPTPKPELCGVFQECQYCENQFTCEEDKIGFCEWVDRGSGEKCYMVEPLPPEQEWEVPELEDCGSLTGVEMWLCEIKNDVLGVFLPSQEKINDLYSTINAFKDKFPFNYAESLKTFFSDVGKSVDEEKVIPIKILGQESNVSFDFWDQETEIGGVSETFKNVLFDFTTLIIVLGFFVWLISLIKRFF